jgi:hypothetical protein
MCRTVPISVAVSAAPEGTLWRCAVIVSASWQSVFIRPLMHDDRVLGIWRRAGDLAAGGPAAHVTSGAARCKVRSSILEHDGQNRG